MSFPPVNFYVSINCHMNGLWYFTLPIMWGHLWWLFFIINLISLKITQILRDVHSWVYLPWHFQGQFNYMCCELANESSLGGFIIPLLGGDGRHEAGLIGGSRHLWHIFEAIFCLGFFCLPFLCFLFIRKEREAFAHTLNIIVFYLRECKQMTMAWSHWNCKLKINTVLSHRYQMFTTKDEETLCHVCLKVCPCTVTWCGYQIDTLGVHSNLYNAVLFEFFFLEVLSSQPGYFCWVSRHTCYFSTRWHPKMRLLTN